MWGIFELKLLLMLLCFRIKPELIYNIYSPVNEYYLCRGALHTLQTIPLANTKWRKPERTDFSKTACPWSFWVLSVENRPAVSRWVTEANNAHTSHFTQVTFSKGPSFSPPSPHLNPNGSTAAMAALNNQRIIRQVLWNKLTNEQQEVQ